MKARFLVVASTTLLLAAVHSSAIAAGVQIAVKVVDRIEYDGLTMAFCQAVGEKSYFLKGQKASIYRTQDAITAGLEENTTLKPIQRLVAKRIATVLTARVYAEIPYQQNDPETKRLIAQLAEVECIQGNSLIQGLTALNMLTAKK